MCSAKDSAGRRVFSIQERWQTGVRERTKHNEKYLLTGATGFLGSHIMAGLLLKGKAVAIAGRPSSGETLKKRIRRLLTWFGLDHLERLLEFYETDFLKPGLGLAPEEYKHLSKSIFGIVHCASDTSFAEKNRARVMRSNVESLTEILNFACESRARIFHFISTAYAAGSDRSECPEAPLKPVGFNNIYEESKAHAEKIVSRRCQEGDLPFTILRPSIVYGDSVTGKSFRFNALYYPVKSLWYIRDIYINDIKNHHGIRSAKYGICIDDTGKLHLPIRIFVPKDGKINLIPVNYFTETVLSILDHPSREPFYHLTCDRPESTARIFSYIERFLNITGVEVVVGTAGADEMRNPPEELFDHFMKAYRPYLSDQRTFARKNTDRISPGALQPKFSYEIFERCMTFAASVDWGKTLFCVSS